LKFLDLKKQYNIVYVSIAAVGRHQKLYRIHRYDRSSNILFHSHQRWSFYSKVCQKLLCILIWCQIVFLK